MYAGRKENRGMNKIPKCHICGTTKVERIHNWVENGIEIEGISQFCPHNEIHDQRPQLVFEHLPERVRKLVSMRFRYGEYEKG